MTRTLSINTLMFDWGVPLIAHLGILPTSLLLASKAGSLISTPSWIKSYFYPHTQWDKGKGHILALPQRKGKGFDQAIVWPGSLVLRSGFRKGWRGLGWKGFGNGSIFTNPVDSHAKLEEHHNFFFVFFFKCTSMNQMENLYLLIDVASFCWL